MALFRTKENVDTATTPSAKTFVAPKQDLSWVLLRPRITEKSTDVSTVRAYVFNISPKANKTQVAAAVRAVYKVTPAKVRMVPIKSKQIRNARTGVAGVKPGGKKAYVYLKEGDSITTM